MIWQRRITRADVLRMVKRRAIEAYAAPAVALSENGGTIENDQALSGHE